MSILSLPIYLIATSLELVLPCEKNIGPLKSPVQLFSSAKDEWVSCKANIHQSLNCFLNI